MRITERKLRSIIKSVIRESFGSDEDYMTKMFRLSDLMWSLGNDNIKYAVRDGNFEEVRNVLADHELRSASDEEIAQGMSFEGDGYPILIVKKDFLMSLGFDKIACSDIADFDDNPYWMCKLSDGSIELGNKDDI